MGKVETAIRAISAGIVALLLALRLLSPAGFMPAFDHGAVVIVACPDSAVDGVPVGAMHHHHGKVKDHQPCPYAAASPVGALATDFIALLAVLIPAATLLLGRTFLFVERNRTRERPPLRGPPVPA
jgi:hypothetical protein